MTNQEKAREICGCEWHKKQGECLGEEECHECSINNEYYHVMTMAKWKDEQNKWHKITDGDLPKEDGDYLLVMKMKYATKEDTSRPYMNVAYFSMKDGWKDPYGEDFAKETIFVAWMELPKYEEE